MAGNLMPQGPNTEIAERLAYWNGALRADSSSGLRNEALEGVNELDEMLAAQGLVGEECLVSGYGTWTEPADPSEVAGPEEPDKVLEIPKIRTMIKKTGNITGKRCISNGFRLGFFDFEPEAPMIVYEFITPGSVEAVVTGLNFKILPLLHMPPNKLSLLLPVTGLPAGSDVSKN